MKYHLSAVIECLSNQVDRIQVDVRSKPYRKGSSIIFSMPFYACEITSRGVN